MPEIKLAARCEAFGLPLKKALLAAAECGATGVEIDARNGLRPSELTDTGLRQLRKMMDDLNLRVSAVRFQTRHGYDYLPGLSERVDATKAAMRMAYRLGARVLINAIGRVPEDQDSPAYQQLAAVMSDLGRFGTHVGAVLAAETGSEPAERLAGLLDHDQQMFVGVAYNPGNLILGGFDPHTSLRAIRDRVQVVIAHDGVQDLSKGRGIEVPVGDGTADFPQILGMLEDAQYRDWFVVGKPNDGAAEVQRSIEYLRNL